MAGIKLPASLEFSPSFQLFPCGYRCSHSSAVAPPVLQLSSNATPFLSPALLITSSRGHTRPQVSRVGKSVCSLKHHMGNRRTAALIKWSQGKRAKLRELGAPGFLQVSANSKADNPIPSEMSLENALKLLGVAEGASFEEILKAKNAILGKHSGDQEIAIQVEVAYDVLLMQSLMQRRAGKVADDKVRYADVKKSSSSSLGSIGENQWIKDALNKFPVAVESPSITIVGTQTAVYAGLMVWTFASGFSSSPSLDRNADVPGLILAIGFGASLYFLRKQNVKLGKAAALTVAGLVAGGVLGGAVESWLRVDLIPVLGISSPAVIVSEFVLVSLWLSSLCLR